MSGIITVTALLAYLGVCIWVYSKSNQARFAEAQMLPFEDHAPRTGRRNRADQA